MVFWFDIDFTIVKDPRGNTLGRGTEIQLQLKKEAAEFLKETKIKNLIAKYSEFINFPVYLWSIKTVEEEVEVPYEMEKESEDGIQDVPEENEDNDIKLTKMEKTSRSFGEWELLNTNKPIWSRANSEVTSQEYKEFFRNVFKQKDDPLSHIHFRAEGDSDFKALIYVPKSPPANFYEPTHVPEKNVRLHVRKVFITDELPDFLPKWMSFVKAIVDSDDIPLSVSRETLQKHASVKIIRKRLISKTIEMFSELGSNQDQTAYDQFYSSYKQSLKFGILESKPTLKKKLIKLLRFASTQENSTSLTAYTERMREKQPQIYYVAGSSKQEASKSPHVETLVARGFEVLYLLDPVDEYLAQDPMKEFNGFPLQNVGKAGLLFGDEDESSLAKEEELKEKFAPLTEFLALKLADFVEKVSISTQLHKTATAVLPNPQGLSAQQERLLALQNAGKGKANPLTKYYMELKRSLEINPVFFVYAAPSHD